jgi:hypothetical protein
MCLAVYFFKIIESNFGFRERCGITSNDIAQVGIKPQTHSCSPKLCILLSGKIYLKMAVIIIRSIIFDPNILAESPAAEKQFLVLSCTALSICMIVF